MKIMDKKEIIGLLRQAVVNYDNNLKNNNIMFIFEDKNAPLKESVKCIQTVFYPTNFLHLTGFKYIPTNNKITSKFNLANDFYNKLLDNKLAPENITYDKSKEYLISMKLNILNFLGSIDKSAKFLGNYMKGSHEKLYTEKVVGNISYCFGFVKDSKQSKNLNEPFYVPNTTLKEDIKNVTEKSYNIIAIFKKDKNEKFYSEVTYLKNNTNLNVLLRNMDIVKLIDFENIYFDNKNNISNYRKVENFRQELNNFVMGRVNLNAEAEDEDEEEL